MSSHKHNKAASAPGDMVDATRDILATAPPRCAKCFYRLEGLSNNRCPECGQAFDLGDEATFTRKPPLVWWRIAMPVLWIVGPFVGLLMVAFYLDNDFGWFVLLAAPLVFGVTSCYLLPMPRIFPLFALLCVAGGILFSFLSVNLAGLVLSILAFIAFAPLVAIGALIGFALREYYRAKSFEHRAWLPPTKPQAARPTAQR